MSGIVFSIFDGIAHFIFTITLGNGYYSIIIPILQMGKLKYSEKLSSLLNVNIWRGSIGPGIGLK